MKDDCTLCRLNQIYVLGEDQRLQLTPPSSSSSSTIMPPNVELSNVDRMLRLITIGGWLPAFPFLLAHGIITEELCPVLGIIPMTFSALAGSVHISGRASSRSANILVDVFVALFLIGVLIPGWIFMADGCSRGWHCGNRAGNAMLGSYGTVPMMINFLIHTFFALRDMRAALVARTATKLCPHCHGDLSPAKSHSTSSREYIRVGEQDGEEAAMSEHSKVFFTPVDMVDAETKTGSVQQGPSSYNHHDAEQPRPSTDDENARLL